MNTIEQMREKLFGCLGDMLKIDIPSLPTYFDVPGYVHLVYRPHPWRRQLTLRARRKPAAQLVRDQVANGMSDEEAADNWGIPVAAVVECREYARSHAALIELEARMDGVIAELSSYREGACTTRPTSAS